MYFIETGYGEQFFTPTVKIVETLVAKLSSMDDEHGAFWMVDENENVVQIEKNLSILIDSPTPKKAISFEVKTNEAAILIFKRFLNGEIDQIRTEASSN